MAITLKLCNGLVLQHDIRCINNIPIMCWDDISQTDSSVVQCSQGREALDFAGRISKLSRVWLRDYPLRRQHSPREARPPHPISLHDVRERPLKGNMKLYFMGMGGME